MLAWFLLDSREKGLREWTFFIFCWKGGWFFILEANLLVYQVPLGRFDILMARLGFSSLSGRFRLHSWQQACPASVTHLRVGSRWIWEYNTSFGPYHADYFSTHICMAYAVEMLQHWASISELQDYILFQCSKLLQIRKRM